jgi:hypothetical protein
MPRDRSSSINTGRLYLTRQIRCVRSWSIGHAGGPDRKPALMEDRRHSPSTTLVDASKRRNRNVVMVISRFAGRTKPRGMLDGPAIWHLRNVCGPKGEQMDVRPRGRGTGSWRCSPPSRRHRACMTTSNIMRSQSLSGTRRGPPESPRSAHPIHSWSSRIVDVKLSHLVKPAGPTLFRWISRMALAESVIGVRRDPRQEAVSRHCVSSIVPVHGASHVALVRVSTACVGTLAKGIAAVRAWDPAVCL